MTFPYRVGLALLSSLFFIATVPPLDAWYVAPLAWTPLLLAIQDQSVARTVGLGWLQGTVTNVLAFWWLVPALTNLDALSPFGSGLGALALCATQGLRSACITALARGLYVGRGWPVTLSGPPLILLAEGLVPLVFPWSTAHLAQGNLYWMQLAELGGTATISLWLAVQAALIATAVSPTTRLPMRRRIAWSGAAFAVLGAGTALGGWLRERAELSMRYGVNQSGLTVGIVQGNVGSVSSRRSDAVPVHRGLSFALLREHSDVDLLVWPETVLSSPTTERDLRRLHRDYLSKDRRLGSTAPRIQKPLLLGLALKENSGADPDTEAVSNAAVLLQSDGSVQGLYRKQALVPLTETELFPGTGSWLPPTSSFVPGPRDQILEFQGHRVGISICYEDILPDLVRRSVIDGQAELLINLTSDAWFAGSPGPRLHLMLARFRAVENRRFLLRASIDGVSALIDPTGRVSWQLPERRALADVVRPAWLAIVTPYHRVGDALVALAAIAVWGMALWRQPASEPSDPAG